MGDDAPTWAEAQQDEIEWQRLRGNQARREGDPVKASGHDREADRLAQQLRDRINKNRRRYE